MFAEITAANIALPKLGQDIGTSAAAKLQVRFVARPFINQLTSRIQLYIFQLASVPGWTNNEYPNFGNADR